MDILNDYYHQSQSNPNEHSDSEESAADAEHIRKLETINIGRKRKKNFTFDDFCLKYNDDMWYIWNIIHDYSLSSNLLNHLTFAKFCSVCYENSTQY